MSALPIFKAILILALTLTTLAHSHRKLTPQTLWMGPKSFAIRCPILGRVDSCKLHLTWPIAIGASMLFPKLQLMVFANVVVVVVRAALATRRISAFCG